MKILITGGGGMIGQAIARRHLAEGDDVFIFDTRVNKYNDYDNCVGRRAGLDHCTLSWLDIADHYAKIEPDILSIQAALVSVGESQKCPDIYLKNNIWHTFDVIQMLGATKPKLIMFAGSMGPYGEGVRVCLNCCKDYVPHVHRKEMVPTCPWCGGQTKPSPMKEDQQPAPMNFYAVSKLAQEHILRVAAASYGIPMVSLRYFSVYGDNSPPENPNTGVLSVIGRKILEGGDIELNEDGLQTRDLVHCDDCADAHYYFARQALTMGDPFTAVNIGTGGAHTLRSITERMVGLMEPGRTMRFNGTVRPGDARDCCADMSKARGLGWYPEIRLDDKLPAYCAWLNERGLRK